MQQIHQSYKFMKAQQKKLSGVHPTCLLTKTQGVLRKPIIGIYKPSSIMKNSHQYMKVTTYETLYHEDNGAIFNAQVWKKRQQHCPFSLFLSFLVGFFGLFLWASLASFIFIKSEVSSRLVGESQSSSSFPHWDNALIMKIITLLLIYNSRITTQYLEQNMTLCECLRRCTGICNESRVTCIKNYRYIGDVSPAYRTNAVRGNSPKLRAQCFQVFDIIIYW